MTMWNFLSKYWRDPSRQILDGTQGLVSSGLLLLHFVVLQGSLNIEIGLNRDNLHRDLLSAILIFNGNMVFLYNIDHLNGILSQHGAVQLHWRKGQFLTRCHQVSGL